MRRRVPNVRTKNPYTPCMAPMAMNKNKMMNSTSSSVLDADQPLRQSKSAKSIETSPVSSSADEKKMNSRQPRWRRGAAATEMVEASAMSVIEQLEPTGKQR